MKIFKLFTGSIHPWTLWKEITKHQNKSTETEGKETVERGSDAKIFEMTHGRPPGIHPWNCRFES
jgi:hypothetical protein